MEQVNAALHAAFDRPDVPLERMESAQPTEQQQQGQQAKEGQPQEGKQVQQLGGKDLRALDLQRDRLVEQVSCPVTWSYGYAFADGHVEQLDVTQIACRGHKIRTIPLFAQHGKRCIQELMRVNSFLS